MKIKPPSHLWPWIAQCFISCDCIVACIVGYSPRGRKELDTTEQLHFQFHFISCDCIVSVPTSVVWDSLYIEKAMTPHSSTLTWKISWMEEPGGLPSMGSLRVGHNWETSLSLFLSCIEEVNGNPFQCSCLENPRDGGAWWAAIYGVAQSRTRLKQLSSSSSRYSK